MNTLALVSAYYLCWHTIAFFVASKGAFILLVFFTHLEDCLSSEFMLLRLDNPASLNHNRKIVSLFSHNQTRKEYSTCWTR